MSQSLSSILVHLTFSTKERRPLVDPAVAAELHKYLAAICHNQGCPAHEVGGTEDHVHIFFTLSRTMALADVVQEIKRSSSKWIKTKGHRYRSFAWQAGYAAFSVAQSGADAVRRYIRDQKRHHAKRDFRAELRALLERHNVDYDERYVWD